MIIKKTMAVIIKECQCYNKIYGDNDSENDDYENGNMTKEIKQIISRANSMVILQIKNNYTKVI